MKKFEDYSDDSKAVSEEIKKLAPEEIEKKLKEIEVAREK